MRTAPWAAAFFAASSLLFAQGQNTTLLDTLDPRPASGYNDIWGYVAPNGDEYALLGARDGTVVVNCVDPTNVYQTGFISGGTSTWRDIRTWDRYAYVVTEAGGSDVQIIDLTDPENPVLAATWGGSVMGSSGAHNVCIDLGTGRMYVVGTNQGTVVADLAANPTSPTYVGTWGTGANADYFHDLCVENGFAYGSMIYNGFLRISDASVFPPTTLSDTATPAFFTHNAWPNAAGTLVATTDERGGGVIKLFDCSNKNSLVPLGEYTPNTAAVPHNVFIIDDVAHMSFYTEGYRALDVSDPTNPVEIGYYDTYPGSSGGTSGAWGCYPFQPSGSIYVSDVSTGLYVLRLDRIRTEHTALPDTQDEMGPYAVTVKATSNTQVQSVELRYSVDGGATTTVAMAPTGNPDEFAAAIPGQRAPSTVTYSFRTADQNNSVTSREYEFFVGTRVIVYSEDFESGPGGYASTNLGPQDDWQYGTPAGKSTDPAAAASGVNCWGNDLGPSGFNGAYQNGTNNYLESPVIPTNGQQGLRLRFRRWLGVEAGQFDQATVFVNGVQIWQNPLSTDLIDTAWTTMEYDISGIANGASTVQIRWQMQADGGVAYGGWNIDDVEILTVTDCVPPEFYGVGTAGSGGLVPTIDIQGDPRLGDSFDVFGDQFVGGGLAILAMGYGPGSVPALGATVLLDPALQVDTFFEPVSGTAGFAGAGTASRACAVPAGPSLDDLDVYFQWLTVDGGGGGQLAASRGMRVRLCSGM